MKYYRDVLNRFAVFTGRASRSEYWYFILFNFIFAIVAAVLDNLLGTTFKLHLGQGVTSMGYGYVYWLYNLVILLPALAVLVRPLHDVGKSGLVSSHHADSPGWRYMAARFAFHRKCCWPK